MTPGAARKTSDRWAAGPKNIGSQKPGLLEPSLRSKPGLLERPGKNGSLFQALKVTRA